MKKGEELFDVTMGAYDVAETFQLLGLFMLYKFAKLNKIIISVFKEMMGWQ